MTWGFLTLTLWQPGKVSKDVIQLFKKWNSTFCNGMLVPSSGKHKLWKNDFKNQLEWLKRDQKKKKKGGESVCRWKDGTAWDSGFNRLSEGKHQLVLHRQISIPWQVWKSRREVLGLHRSWKMEGGLWKGETYIGGT